MLEYKKSLKSLQVDQFSRQNIVFQLVKAARPNRIRILDVGGHLGKTRDFFRSDDVIVTDLYDCKDRNYVKASALDLPFKDGEFDAVVSFDVLEHIAEKDRKIFLKEISRVSSDIVAIAAPFDTELVAQVEKEINQSFRAIYGKNHPWLIEHIENGLPDLTIVTDFFKKQGFNYSIYSSNNLFLWKMMMNFYFISGNSRLATLSKKLNEFYNQNSSLLGDHTGPSYRKVIFARKRLNEKGLPRFESVIDNEVYNELLEKLSKGTISVLKDKQLSIEQASAIRERETIVRMTEDLDSMRRSIDQIVNSKAWRAINHLRRFMSMLKK